MNSLYIVVGIIVIVFGWKLFTILRNPEINRTGKRMAISIFVFSVIALIVAIFYGKE
ncbi:hypothetical protein [Paenisporosarcina cavernae]|uniref:hypothetical protein n=1 Tax=Paenisporosarcina cavernae TaxID=2320858 RepID=UPI0013C528BB|nr:hypothetical protein [Paenisporosarcina cavernae]